MLIVLATSPRVAPGLLSWSAWDALRSAAAVLAPAGHPLLPALDEAGIRYRVADEPGAQPADGTVVWLPEPGDVPPVPPGARLLHGSADLPGAHLLDLVATMDRLRVECPWDARQTHQTLAPHLLEEPYEALEALESGDDRAFCEELGDVLLQVVFHARVAAERADGYTIDDVADGIVAKLVRRHPHVFADRAVSGADEVVANWEEIKAAERAGKSSVSGVPMAAPALTLAATLQRKAAKLDVVPPVTGASLDDLVAAWTANPNAETAGELLWGLVETMRARDVDAETALRARARVFRDQLVAAEQSSVS